MLGVASQENARMDNPLLEKSYSTNDRTLRCKILNEHLFMDAFFSTKKAKKSPRVNLYVQLFVTDKGFACVVHTKSKSEVLLAIKYFAK